MQSGNNPAQFAARIVELEQQLAQANEAVQGEQHAREQTLGDLERVRAQLSPVQQKLTEAQRRITELEDFQSKYLNQPTIDSGYLLVTRYQTSDGSYFTLETDAQTHVAALKLSLDFNLPFETAKNMVLQRGLVEKHLAITDSTSPPSPTPTVTPRVS